MIFTGRFLVLFTLAVAVAGLSVNDLDKCARNCLDTTAAESACKSPTNYPCLCNSQPFQTALGNCMRAHCSPKNGPIIHALQKQKCAGLVKPTHAAVAAN